MNRIVKEHYPIERLPEDLRAGMTSNSRVTVTVVEEDGATRQRLSALLEAMDASDRPRRSLQEIDAHIRELRED